MLAYNKFGKKNFDYVFLHGFCEDSRMWTDFIKNSGFNAITIDLPGYGNSSEIEVESLASMAEDVHTTMENLGISDFILAGHSMGGYVAMEYLSKYPDQLKGLALIHSHPFADDDIRKTQRRKSIEFIDNYGVEAYAKQFFPKLFATENKNNFAVHSLSLRATQIPTSTVIDSLEAMIKRKDHRHTFCNSTRPVLQVLGKEDNLINFKSNLELSVEPELSMIEIYDYVGHMSLYEKPTLLRDSLRKFLEFCQITTKA